MKCHLLSHQYLYWWIVFAFLMIIRELIWLYGKWKNLELKKLGLNSLKLAIKIFKVCTVALVKWNFLNGSHCTFRIMVIHWCWLTINLCEQLYITWEITEQCILELTIKYNGSPSGLMLKGALWGDWRRGRKELIGTTIASVTIFILYQTFMVLLLSFV